MSEDDLPDVEVEESGKDSNRDDRTDEQSASLPQGWDTVLHRSLILIVRVQLAILGPATPNNISSVFYDSYRPRFEFRDLTVQIFGCLPIGDERILMRMSVKEYSKMIKTPGQSNR